MAETGIRADRCIWPRDWQCGHPSGGFVPGQTALMRPISGRSGAKTPPRHAAPRDIGDIRTFIGILIEEHRSKLPSCCPRQVVVAAITQRPMTSPRGRPPTLKAQGVRAEADVRQRKVNYKVRETFGWQSAGDPCRWRPVRSKRKPFPGASVPGRISKLRSGAIGRGRCGWHIESTPPDQRG